MAPQIKYNLLAFLTVTLWGLTFVSTKILINSGLTPAWIFIIRFSIAYICVLAICHKKFWADSIKDELYMLSLGLTGGSLYFLLENTALKFTFATNVSLIICATPVLTMLLCAAYARQRIGWKAWLGTGLAIVGVGAVVFNGSRHFGINPIGDVLTLLAALCWAIYSLLLMKQNGRYSNLFITRKVFFYGWVTALGFCLFQGLPPMPSPGSYTVIAINVAFLSLIASFACYIIWNESVKIIGPERSANYIYFQPVVSIAASSFILHEPVTPWLIIGAVITIFGVYLSSSGMKTTHR